MFTQTTDRPIGHDAAVSALRTHSDNPSAFLALNQANRRFMIEGIDGFISYRQAGRHWIQFGEPFAAVADRPRLLEQFCQYAKKDRRHIVAVQLQRADAELYQAAGFTVNQLGASYAVDLQQFSVAGKKFVRFRNKISRARRAGLDVCEAAPSDAADQLARIDAPWLRQKGRFARELTFLVGEIGGPAQDLRRLYLGSVHGRPVGYISYAPVFGSRPGMLHDLSRRVPDAPPGVMEAMNMHAIEQFRAAGVRWLHFGFTPFTGLSEEHELPSHSGIVSRIARLLATHGEMVYPSRTQLEYKLKWNPTVILPEYVASKGALSLPAIIGLMRVTNTI